MTKNDLLNILDETKTIVERNHLLTSELNAQFVERRQAIENFKAKILFVGGFSAGKSALINAFLGDYVLEENISPETAVATEIPVDEFPELMLVDMPGFDSGIEAHNAALVQYMGEAAAYIFVIDTEKGTVSQSGIQFLNEIKNYSRFIRFVLTKTDKSTPDDVDAVVQHVGDVLERELDDRPDIVTTFSRDPEAHDKIKTLLEEFPTERLMLFKLGGELLLLLNQSIDALKVQLSSLEFTARDIDEAIDDRERQKAKLEREMQFHRRELHLKMQSENTMRILDDAEAALRSQLDSLAEAAEQGGDIFSERVNSILRPVLMQSTREYVGISVNEFVDALGNVNQSDPNELNDKIDTARRTADALKTMLERGADFAKTHDLNKVFKVMSTGLAVLTNVIAPWMELVIIFLPEIVGTLNSLFGRSPQEQIKNKLEFEIIPQMREKLRPVVQESMSEVETQLVEQIERQFNDALEVEIDALERLREEKAQREFDVQSKRAALVEDINSIRIRAEQIKEAMA